MLILPIKIAEDTYAIGIENIKEIIPVVEFSILPSAKDYIKGLINYRGTVCPVIDISQLIKGISAKIFLSTRIIMIDSGTEYGAYGLLAERVTETVYVNPDDFNPVSGSLTSATFIDKTIILDGKIVQIINPEKIFSKKLTIFLGTNTI
jgi:chemotaxis-related protein WspB